MDRERITRKPRWPRHSGPCRAFTEPAHPADPTKFTGYCQQHENEYQIHRLRYNNWTYNFNHGRTSKRPPSKEEYFQTVTFSPLNASTVSVSLEAIEQANRKLNQLQCLARDIEKHIEDFSAPLLKYPELWKEFRALLDYSRTLSFEIEPKGTTSKRS